MVHHCCSKQKVKRGLWSPEEDEKLIKYITTHGHGSWSSIPKLAGQNHPQNVPAVSSSPLNPSGFDLIDENCIWNNETTMEIQPQPQNVIYEVEIEKPNGQNNNMSTSFERSDFDFEFVESTVMPCGMYSNLTVIDQFAWDC
ncbi:hypothetical protein Patl1_11981 [Pistacia atlantica]|uniref:Uncharacterized protein n=1 Tax=Pistacia atlantica TaxID=434234 RepID=A0ACC1A1V6_9ROSI|nr:hypothetical protein Patl1_11981 [Pistacia atlantica]